MKKKSLLILLLPFVVSCGLTTSTPSTSENKVLEIQTVLSDLQKGVKVSVEMEEKKGEISKKLYLQNASKEKEFSFIQYMDETRTKKGIHEYYVAKSNDEENLVYSTRLNVNNEYEYYSLYNPDTSDYFTWDDGYNNAFLSLSVDSFTKINDLQYDLKEELLKDKSNEFSTLIYGNPGLELSSLSLIQNEEGISLNGTFAFSDTHSYVYEAKIMEMGQNVQMDYRMKPFDKVEDQAFEQMLASLDNDNYTVTVENYDDDILDNTSIYYSEKDQIYYETGDFKAGYYVLEDGSIQEVTKDGEDFYKVGSPMEGSLDEIRAEFSINRACFDKVDDIYKLKDGVEGSLGAITVFEAYADELDDFTLKIESGSYTFTNVLGSYKTVVRITNVSNTSVGFTSDTVLEPVSGVSWSDVLDEESYELLVSVAGEEANSIPVPDNYSTWALEYIEDEITCAFLLAEASETLEDDYFAYSLKLIEAGFMMYEEEVGYVGEGIMFIKEAVVNDTPCILIVELVEFGEAFAIAVYTITE